MGMRMRLCLMPGMIMVMAAVDPLVVMGCIVRHMTVLVLMTMRMGMPVGMGMGVAVMGMGVFMFMGMLMMMGMSVSVHFDLHRVPPFSEKSDPAADQQDLLLSIPVL